ncbi:MAG: hypothetical protein KatS3mg035_2108 [Bacteroidia bacterium]|nr:MAG: hypothetical protein KatS3mg035_2108 [Bacteroidia bacterium]
MAVYRIAKDSLFLTELPMYGEKRLGVIKENKFLMKKPIGINVSFGVINFTNFSFGKHNGKQTVYTLGKKHYETTDWLGNVRVTYTDKKSWQQNKFALNISSSLDYYPFGSVMEGRALEITNYRFGFQGQEGDDEVYGKNNLWAYKYRLHDSRLGRFFSVDPLAGKYPYNSVYAFSENRVIDGVELEGLEKRIIINNSLDGYKEKIHTLSEKDVKNAGMFTAFALLMKDIGLLDDNTDLHFKHLGVSQSFNGSNVDILANYEAVWLFNEQIIRINIAIPVSSIHITGANPSDYLLSLVGTGLYSQIFKKALRPLYTQAAENIRATALGLLKSGKLNVSEAAKFANAARNKLKIKFLESTPEDLRNLIFKYNEARGLNKWGTKSYEELRKTKSDYEIIESAASPQPSLKALGEDIYKVLGEEAVPVLKKYKILPKNKK